VLGKARKRFFFEKKEAKKLLAVRARGGDAVATHHVLRSESFLVLFFKKEPLTFLF
jgi:hypothetical protein